jgi:Carboxypeptidase regulatory-like domain
MSAQRWCAFTTFALWLMVPAAYAQEVRASITGMVTDPSGAPIVAAKVTARDLATGRSVATLTNDTGNYLTPFLAPGRWELTVEASGFKKYVRQDIVLQALDRARVDAWTSAKSLPASW